MQDISISTAVEFRKRVWGKHPSAKQRRKIIQHELREANIEFNKEVLLGTLHQSECSTPFVFLVHGKSMCEKSYVNLLGLADNKGYKSKIWNDESQIIQGDFFICAHHHSLYFMVLFYY